MPASDLREDPDTTDRSARDRRLTLANAETQRVLLAERIGVPVEKVKPCVALLGNIPEGHRKEFCWRLVIELVRAGAAEESIRGHVGYYVESQCQQPPFADEQFTHREAERVVRDVLEMAKHARIFGHSCKNPQNPLLQFCPFRSSHENWHYDCPYVRGFFKQPKRKSISTLIGSLNLLVSHKAPARWKERQRMRRALLTWTIGALEQVKGHAGAELITSEDELVRYFPGRITRKTVRTDLQAMEQAKQIRWIRGQGWRAGQPRVGMRITRLFPPDRERVAAALEAFPGAEEE
jgi:hypothetical protein